MSSPATLTKAELVTRVSDRAGLTKADTTRVLESLVAVTTQALQDGKAIALPSLGKIEPKGRAPRTFRNPQTGALVEKAKTFTAVFKAAKSLKDALNR